MRRIAYLAAECFAVWLILSGAQITLLYFLTDFSDLWQLLALALTVGAVPVAIKWVLFRPGELSAASGIYDPVRPIAALRQSGLLESDDAGRLRFAFDYLDSSGRDAIDIVALLAHELNRQGVRNANVGFLRVQDGGSQWVVEPCLHGPRLSGWVEADRKDDRHQVVDGIRDYLVEGLGLQVVEAGR